MGNNPSKPPGETPSAPPSSHGSTKSSRQISKPLPTRTKNAGPGGDQSAKSHAAEQTHSSSQSISREQISDHDGGKRAGHREEANKTRIKVAPMTVPRAVEGRRQRGPDMPLEPSGPPKDANFVPHSNFGLPPRLPLPIGEELHRPGSPIIGEEGSSVLHEENVEGLLPRQRSTTSNTTQDDDDIGDELEQYPHDVTQRTVSTPVFWRQNGEKVYVTGTFTGWSRKFRMYRDKSTGHLSAVLQLPPGTHHVKFIVDGEMKLSDELPTAVDYTNILVNYIEVSADDVPDHSDARTVESKASPHVLPEGTEAKDHDQSAISKPHITEAELKATETTWGREIPPYINDIDQSENTNRYQRAVHAVAEFAHPPGLPMFLGKSILNGTTLMKDDNSVLNMPNHTVLNHLATSSIKNDVLATSITTRYIRKYVTTVVYKPTEDSV